MRPEQKLSALRKILGREEFQKGDEAVFFCPKHQHYKPKLSVNLKYDNFNCWICGFKGANLKPILFLKGKTDDAVRYASEIDGNRGKHTEDKTYDIPTLPDSFEPLVLGGHDPYTRHAIEYLKSRGLDEYDFLKYKIGFCKEGECRFRVIFPSFDSDGNLNFFVGRKVYDHVGLSYKHGNFNKNIIFNDYLIDWDKPVTLVEGPIDAIIAGDNAIPLQGTILREDSLLFAKIVTSGVHVNIALDSDAKKKEWDMADKRHGRQTYVIWC
jgi:DNA primase